MSHPSAVSLRPVLVPVAALLLAGCIQEGSGPLQSRTDMFVWEGVIPAGGVLRVRELRGSIEVRPATGDTARVRANVEWRSGDPERDLHFSASPQGGDVLICAVWGEGSCTREGYNARLRGGRRNRVTDAKVHFLVEVPTGVRLDLTNIDGDIVAASSAPVQARTMNGNVTVATAVGPVQAETMNGHVDARMMSLAGTDSVVAKTMNGDVFVYLPEGPDIALDMAVTSGSISSEFPTEGMGGSRSLKAVLGAGTTPVRIRTLNGRVALRRLDAEGRSAP